MPGFRRRRSFKRRGGRRRSGFKRKGFKRRGQAGRRVRIGFRM